MTAGARATLAPDTESVWEPTFPVDVAATLSPLGRGPGDPTHRQLPGGEVWRTTRTATGPATYRLQQVSQSKVRCSAWGPGAASVAGELPTLLGAAEDHADFEPRLPMLVDAHRRLAGMRTPRTERVLEALIPAVLEQRVLTIDAHRSWRLLVQRYGDPAPGPGGLRLAPTAEAWRLIPSWEWHRAGVDPQRAGTAVRCAQVAGRLEQCTDLSPDDAVRRLTAIPGVGAWTAAEVAQRALGDADAVSVGDFHLARDVGRALIGRPLDDAGMLEALEGWRPFRYRVIRLLGAVGAGRRPRRAPRSPRIDYSRL